MTNDSRTPKNFKARLEANPILYLISVSVAVAMVIVGVMDYWCNQRSAVAEDGLKNQISVLQNEMSSIKRGVGDNKFLDIRAFLYPKGGSPSSPINLKSKYVSSEEFFAITDLPGWEYERLTAEEFWHKTYHVHFTGPTFKIMGQLPLHVWRPSVGLTVVESKNSSEIGPLISLQKIPLERTLKGSLEAQAKEIEEERKLNRPPFFASLSTEELERAFQGDVAEHMLATWIDLHLAGSLDAPEANSSLVQLQKLGNVVYAQLLTTVHDCEVDGKKVAVYFVRHEMIIITDREYTTQIEIVVPSADPSPRGPVYSTIQVWFSGLALPVA